MSWRGTFCTLEKRSGGSLEKRLHLLPALHGLVIGCQNVSAAACDGSSQCAFPTAAELHTLAWCKMLLPQNDHTSLSPPRAWMVTGRKQQ